MAIIKPFSRGHRMALFLVLFNRCRAPLFPVSPFALSGRARILMPMTEQKQVGCSLCIFIFSKASSGSALVLFQVQSLFNKDLFSFSPISHFVD